jgi:hypothetical protein
MIATILLGAMLQTAPIRPEVWKERNHPDMPAIPPCELGGGTTIAHSMKELPADVVTELTRFFNAATPMSDAGGPFNSTDVAGESVSGTWPALVGSSWMTPSRVVQERVAAQQELGDAKPGGPGTGSGSRLTDRAGR